jgi:hypothetical protein
VVTIRELPSGGEYDRGGKRLRASGKVGHRGPEERKMQFLEVSSGSV